MPPANREPPDKNSMFSQECPLQNITSPATKPVSIDPATSGEILKTIISGKYNRNKPVLKYYETIPSNKQGKSIVLSKAATDQPAPRRQVSGSIKNLVATDHPASKRQVSGAPATYHPASKRQVLLGRVPLLAATDQPPPKRQVSGSINQSMPKIIKKLLTTSSSYEPPKFIFQNHENAAAYNLNILQENDFDLESLLNPPQFRCATSYGSEFKAVEELEPLLKRHPRWGDLKRHLQHGFEFDVKTLSDEERSRDLEAVMTRGNHKSAQEKEDLLSEAMKIEVKKAWALILPLEAWKDISDLEVAPMGIATRLGIAATGEYVEKDRITHDLSWKGEFSKTSINSRINEDSLDPVMFGHCISRIIHNIVNLILTTRY